MKTGEWSDQERQELRDRVAAGDPISAVAASLDRTYRSVHSQARWLGIVVKFSPSIWTDEKDAILRCYYGSGLSAESITVLLGSGFSRSAVLGRARRLGLPGPRTVPRVRRTRPPAPPRVVVAPAPPPVSRRLNIMELQSLDCRWPDEGDQAPYTFCGTLQDGESSYCAYHRRINRR